eukprot:scaffold664_cov260-Pinguiococcus_pyrenoidosus.AAC.1
MVPSPRHGRRLRHEHVASRAVVPLELREGVRSWAKRRAAVGLVGRERKRSPVLRWRHSRRGRLRRGDDGRVVGLRNPPALGLPMLSGVLAAGLQPV